jgi:glycosyltransferase involved in cell wall biosynthesis
VVQGLNQRGHDTLVLTSMHGLAQRKADDGVDRALYLEMDLIPWRYPVIFFTQRRQREAHNLQHLFSVLQHYHPDIIFIWGMWNLHRSLAKLAEDQLSGRTVYRFAEYWPTLPSQHELYWRTPGKTWYSRPAKRLLRLLALMTLRRDRHQHSLRFEHAICVSEATRDVLVSAGLPVSHARIIHTGLEPSWFPSESDHRSRYAREGLELLYAGRLTPEKGIETALYAMSTLVHEKGLDGLQLRIAGSGDPTYENRLRMLVAKLKLANNVKFLGQIPHAEMSKLLCSHDALLVPSIWQEPFARVVLEGMISGTVVVATPAGGTKEIITDGQNGLLFMPADSDDLAQKILILSQNPDLRQVLSESGRRTIRENFTFDRMLGKIERYLLEVAGTIASR